MSAWMGFGLVLLFAGLAAWAHYRYWVRRFTRPQHYDETLALSTPDGATIELRRLDSRGGNPGESTRPPVLLVHGIAANHRNVDPLPDLSLARSLAESGRTVWLLSLRCGRTGLPRSERKNARFARMAQYDLPRAWDAVRSRSGAAQLDYVGFSMGGMLLYASLGRYLDPAGLRRAVFIGAPGRVRLPRWLSRLARWIPRWAVPSLPVRGLGRMLAFYLNRLPMVAGQLVFNRANTAVGSVGAALVNMIVDVPGPLQADFNQWAGDAGRVHVNGRPLLERLPDAEAPALFVAGASDRVAPVAAVRAAYEAWGARTNTDKSFLELGRSQGCQHDYGHGDLAIGAHLPRELFPHVIRFLS